MTSRTPTLVSLLLASSIGHSAAEAGGVVVKRIVNGVSWWPPSMLKDSEAIGVVSRGVMFATGMLENTTDPTGAPFDPQQFTLELKDLHDIVVASNTSLENVVDCLANVPVGKGNAALAEAALIKRFGGPNHAPAITILESLGEYAVDNSSISCTAAVNPDNTKGDPVRSRSRLSFRDGLCNTTVIEQVDGMIWLAAEATGDHAAGSGGTGAAHALWSDISVALDVATDQNVNAKDIVDCTVFVPLSTTETTVSQIRDEAAKATSGGNVPVAAQLTVVKTTLGVANHADFHVKLRCTAFVGGGSEKKKYTTAAVHGNTTITTVTARGFAYVSGVGSSMMNATDGFAEISRALQAAGSRMNLMLNCLTWAQTPSDGLESFFDGFQQAFNVDAFPPPSVCEFIGISARSQCLDPARCPIMSKCVAALPAERSIEMVV